MNPQDSLRSNFASMNDEFSSCNNRTMREISRLFSENLNDLMANLNYFNDEYEVIPTRILEEEFEVLKEKLMTVEIEHVSNYVKMFNREKMVLEQGMCNFFKDKLVKGESCKRKMSSDIKYVLDKMCDFNMLMFEEELDNIIYNFKVDFETKYICNEYCKDDFNKIVKSFKHSLIENMRDTLVTSIGEMQNVVSRYITSGYEIVDYYRNTRKVA